MDIRRAKKEIKYTVEAYLKKDEFGHYKIPTIHQRPIFLVGPPGIGKTAIMEQIARECQIGFVSYTMTHHTRQSAIGLPFIKEETFDGQSYQVTEYTMSEIIASVHRKIEETGKTEGILFLDEINCVSETLAPTMLQFLQGKTFGNHKVPEGYIIVAAGNPPEYNRSVKEFDVVTLDRIRKLEVEQDYQVFKEYGYRQGVHDSILSYLELKKDNFYRIETTVDGKSFVTARGWEDLSRMLYLYEEMEIPVDETFVYQYIQHRQTASDFATYYALYQKYKDEYHIGEMLEGKEDILVSEQLQKAAFDEKLSVVSLLVSKLTENFKEVLWCDEFVTKLHGILTKLKEMIEDGQQENAWIMIAKEVEEEYQGKKRAGHLTKEEEKIYFAVHKFLDNYTREIASRRVTKNEEQIEVLRTFFEKETVCREEIIERAERQLEIAFTFMEENFAESQEMVIFLTELTANYYSMNFIREYGSEPYYRYQKQLLLSEQKEEVLRELRTLKLQA